MLDVTGTTVTTPRPNRSAVLFAPSLLTMTAGRRLFDSDPTTGSRSTQRISPRRTNRVRQSTSSPTALRRLGPTRPRLVRRQLPALRPSIDGLLCERRLTEMRSPETRHTHRGTRHPRPGGSRSPSYLDATAGSHSGATPGGSWSRRGLWSCGVGTSARQSDHLSLALTPANPCGHARSH